MVKILLLYRKKVIGRLSIENVFEPIARLPYIHKIELPYELTSFSNALRLFICALKIKETNIHITGDVHYMAFFLFWKHTILTIHDCNHYEDLKGVRKFFVGLIWFKLPIFFANKITVISPFAKKQLQSHFRISDNKIVVIPNSFYSFKPVQRFYGLEPFVILVIGTKSNKNLGRLAQVIHGMDGIQLHIVGRLNEQLEQMLKENSIDYSNFFNLTRNELEEKYANSHLLYFASTKEGFGLPILEAQSSGLPVITSNTTSMPYVAGKGACIVDPYNLNEIKNGILKIKTDSEFREEITKEGFKNIKRFTENTFLNSYLELYGKIFR